MTATQLILSPETLNLNEPIRADIFGIEHLEAHACRVARATGHGPAVPGPPLLQRFEENSRALVRAHRLISEAYRRDERLGAEAEWLLDNFHIISDTLREIRIDLPSGYYRLLPKDPNGTPCVYALAFELIAHCDSGLDETKITRFVQAYQTESPLTIGELWAVPAMLRLVLIENLRRLADLIVESCLIRQQAQVWTAPWLAELEKNTARPARLPLPAGAGDRFLVCLFELLREQPHGLAGVELLEAELAQRGTAPADLLRRAQQAQAANQVSIGNSVTSLRLLAALDWAAFFERSSVVEAILREDPAEVYPRQDFATRDRCRQVVEKLARGSGRSEIQVARAALALAGAPPAPTTPPPAAPAIDSAHHIGFYLLDEGRDQLEALLGFRPALKDRLSRLVLRQARGIYFGGVALLTLLVLTLVLSLASVTGWLAAAMALLVLWPVSELAIGFMNRLVVWMVPPRTLPKLRFVEGVPVDCATIVVMPTMLVRPESAKVLLDRLEGHYLANADPQLYFALLTDFADAPQERMPEDEKYIQAALEGIRLLNERHAADGPDRFLLFHRARRWNPVEGCWMGWERKRGKLSEFNRLLRGDRATSYSVVSGDPSRLPRLRFVITLDADTQLPHESARRLIATLAHPLNQPVFDPERRRITRGYGLLQPRVSFTLPGSRKSLFAWLFSGSAGLDPYTTAVSDVYQDLFAIGSFIGKGIYDIDAFEAAVGHTFPDNSILSHDLIEGNFARCGLVTDIEFLDDFPARYHAFARREHRWIRGDWQISPWLFGRVKTGSTIRNPLPFVERWKIFDNLRRSLLPVVLVLMLVLGWTVLSGSPWLWTGLALLVLSWPLWMHGLGLLVHMMGQVIRGRGFRLLPGELLPTIGQVLLAPTFLLDQARHAADAIARTLIRLLITRRHLLEWETAASAERRLGAELADFCRFMSPTCLLALGLAVLVGWWRPEALPAAALFLIPWLLSPLVAYWISQPRVVAAPTVLPADHRQLRMLARKTWSFFEEFVTADDHWLPPDNFQEDPKGVIAHRTSPTNMGLYLLSALAAHDLGYLGLGGLIERLEKTFATFDQLERSHGHFCNWYDTQTLKLLQPVYLSTVDSGNLMACFLTLHHGLLEKMREPFPGPQVRQGLADSLALIDALAHSLIRPGAPPGDFRRLLALIQDLHGQLERTPTELSHWYGWLQRLDLAVQDLDQQLHGIAALIGEEPWGLVRWSKALAAQIDALWHEVGTLVPWIEELDRAAGLAQTAQLDPALAERWQGVLRQLNKPISAEAVQASMPALQAELTALRQAWPTAEGQQRLAELANAVTRQTAANLLERGGRLAERARDLAEEMDFKILYNGPRDLFSVGYNLSQGRLDNAHYDLLASEACLTSFLAVARGDVPKRHWFQLGRPLTQTAGAPCLLSWGGTMFEYLMPRLLLNCLPDTLLAESQQAAVIRQIEYGRDRRMPWGISESAFSAVDADLNYQYQAFGVPGLGLKRGLGKDLVVAPYATALAVGIQPTAVAENFRRLADEGGEGRFGFYESIDYTPERLPPQSRSVVVKCFMAHHQGMALVALTNCLLGNPMPRRLHAEPMVRATELLLQERVPSAAPFVQPPADESALPAPSDNDGFLVSRRLSTPHTSYPRTHVLSNGHYSVMLTNAGSGRSWCRDQDITRWREDRTRDHWGQFIYIKDLRQGTIWSAGYQPTCQEADEYEVTYSTDKAEIRRVDGGAETRLEVAVSSENQAEVRRVTITNHGSKSLYLEVTSYAEVVLTQHGADLAHPAFQKLFLETEYVAGEEALLCRRRPRSPEQKPVWAVHVLAVEGETVGEAQYETDRALFLGRGRTPANPQALEGRLSGTVGAVLDPVLSLRRQVRVPRDSSVSLAFTTAFAESHAEAMALADQYHDLHNVARAFELAWAHSQVELRHLHLTPEDAHLFQRLATHLFYAGPLFRAGPVVLAANRLGQSGLWRHGVSGDHPIVLLTLADQDQLGLVRQLIAAHTYWRAKGLVVDLVIINEEPTGYFEDVQPQLLNLLRTSEIRNLLDKPGGVFVLKSAYLNPEDQNLLRAAARCILVAGRGSLGSQVERLERLAAPVERPSEVEYPPRRRRQVASAPLAPLPAPLRYGNGVGGFASDGRDYVIQHAAGGPPTPWVNVIANPNCGFIVSESGGGCTWAGNSQNNRLTPWNNDPVSDPPGELIYLRDEETGAVWTAVPFPRRAAPFRIRHGQGQTVFEHTEQGLHHELSLFVPAEDPVKICHLRLRNLGQEGRKLSATFFAEWVLGTNRDVTAMHVVTEIDPQSGALLARNPFNPDYAARIAFADVSVRPRSFTADRTAFVGRNGSLERPAAMTRAHFSEKVGPGLDPCAVLRGLIEIPAGAEREIVFVLGQADSLDQARELADRYRDPAAAARARREVLAHWDHVLGAIQVHTPNPALDLLLNRWLLYQVLSCRMWGRSALYQSGGAYGFRDQLQDVLALLHAQPQEARAHILRAAGRQFGEGDVQHWWHPPSGAGVRTRFSDDFLWLPYAVSQYVSATGDRSILDEVVPFLKAPVLRPDQEEDYRIPEISDETASLYEHCQRAIRHGLRFGPHGLPLIGTGDWNDGFNRIGAGGQGESVWNAWFLITILRDFALLTQDPAQVQWFQMQGERLRQAVEAQAWDGQWYRRAYFDDGTPLGSASNDECQIDSLAQSWSVISGGAAPDRAGQAMRAVDQYLVREADRLVLLFTPPFNQTKLEPGYIKGYVPGIRENGGQYTHAALWVVQAMALLGRPERAMELLDLLNPILHAASREAVLRYRVEPYVVAADVYGQPPHTGRGGWTWYTGSAGWFYRVALETILGFERHGQRLTIRPRIPAHWPGFQITYRYGSSTYHIQVENRPAHPGADIPNGQAAVQEWIDLIDDGQEHHVQIQVRAVAAPLPQH